jgi:hypothetical protein
LRYTIRAVYGNALLSFIRNRMVDRVIYQSQFIKGWWEDWYRPARVPPLSPQWVDLLRYTPMACMNVLLNIIACWSWREPGWAWTRDYSARRSANTLSKKFKIELMVVGRGSGAKTN